jgi:hypothetical protein
VFDDMLKKPFPYHRLRSTKPSSSVTCSKNTTAAPSRRMARPRRMVVMGRRRLPDGGERLPHLRGANRGHVQQPAQVGAA